MRAWRHTTGRRAMFGLFVRFTCKDEAAAEAYDKLVAETIEAIKAASLETAQARLHTVEGQPLSEVFSYELYRDRATFEGARASRHPPLLQGADSTWPAPRSSRSPLQTGKGTGGRRPRTTEGPRAENRRRSGAAGLAQPELARTGADRSGGLGLPGRAPGVRRPTTCPFGGPARRRAADARRRAGRQGTRRCRRCPPRTPGASGLRLSAGAYALRAMPTADAPAATRFAANPARRGS